MTQVAFIPSGRYILLMSCNASILCNNGNVVLAQNVRLVFIAQFTMRTCNLLSLLPDYVQNSGKSTAIQSEI